MKNKEILEILKNLDRCLPKSEQQCSISVRLYSDWSGTFILEVWGENVAFAPIGDSFSLSRVAMKGASQDKFNLVVSIVKNLNSVMANINSK